MLSNKVGGLGVTLIELRRRLSTTGGAALQKDALGWVDPSRSPVYKCHQQRSPVIYCLKLGSIQLGSHVSQRRGLPPDRTGLTPRWVPRGFSVMVRAIVPPNHLKIYLK